MRLLKPRSALIDGRAMSSSQSSHGAALEAATSSVQEALIDLHGLPVEVAKIAVQALLQIPSAWKDCTWVFIPRARFFHLEVWMLRTDLDATGMMLF